MSRKRTKTTKRKSIDELMAQDEQRAKSRSNSDPFRFYQYKGEECKIIFLDDEVTPFARFEHNMKQPNGKYGRIEPCLQDMAATCPHCAQDNYAYLGFFVSVLVLREYEIKKGDRKGEVIPHSKMVLMFKKGQLQEFKKIEKIALKKYGTLRGVSIGLERADVDKSPGNGSPTPDEDGNLIWDFYSEEALVEEFGHDEVIGREQKVIRPENDDITPYDFYAVYPEPDVEAELDKAGATPAAGSRQEEDDDDEIPMGDVPKRQKRKRSRKVRSKASDDDVIDVESEAVEPKKKGKKSKKPKDKTKTKRKRSRSKQVEDEPEF